MKDFIKKLSGGMIFGVGFVIVLGISYLAIKARQNTNPGITDSTPDALYVNNNDTLTAAKRNTLIDSVKNNGETGIIRIGNVQICRGDTAFSISSSSSATVPVYFSKPFKDTNYTLTASNKTLISSNAFTVYSIDNTSTTEGRVSVIHIDAQARTGSGKVSRVAIGLWR